MCRRDDRVDGLHESLFRILLTHMLEDPRRIGASMSLFLVSRNLERMFLVEGRTTKHGHGQADEARAG